ncbi:MAG: hypothetical protein WC159_08460 [Sphaerochaetaceae bacterium]|jgi:mRNA-degrading endonuclease RelE of RelBE toxin-antitoxin system
MHFQITTSSRFEKSYSKLTQVERKQLKSKLELLAKNPLHPSLRTKRIQGSESLFEFSVNMDVRVIWYHEGNLIIVLLDVGHHDVLGKY